MSDEVKLAGNLPKHDALNGLVAVADDAVKNPDGTQVWAVVLLDVKDVRLNVDTGERIPTLRVRRVEPLLAEDQKTRAAGMMSRCHETRMGVRELPLNLDEQLGFHG